MRWAYHIVLLLVVGSYGAAAFWIDITAPVQHGLPVFESKSGLPRTWRTLAGSIKHWGDDYTISWLNFGAHTGTHIDAPAHFLADGSTIESLSLGDLMGSALVVDVPPGVNITGKHNQL